MNEGRSVDFVVGSGLGCSCGFCLAARSGCTLTYGDHHMVKKDGGPAFPGEVGTGHFTATQTTGGYGIACEITEKMPGMTLRDWFAGQVLAGMMSNPYFMEHTLYDLNGRVAVAYHHADAMLAERER